MVNQIKDFRMTRMSMGSCCFFHSTILDLIAEHTAEVLHVEAFVPEYRRLTDKLQRVLNRRRKFVSTHEMREKDKRRDRGAGYIKMCVNAALTSLIDEKREAAELLAPKLRSFKRIVDHKYTEANSEVRAMLSLLAEPENAAAIAALHLTEDVEALRQANEDCSEALLHKVDEYVELDEQRHTDSDELVSALNAQYSRIVKYVNAFAIAAPTESIELFIRQVNANIQDAALVIAHSGSGQN